MSKAYYTKNLHTLPPMEAATKDAMIYYLWETLFSEYESFEEGKKRFIKAAVNENPDTTFFNMNQQSKITNTPIPFVAWNIVGYSENKKIHNSRARIKKNYIEELNSYIGVTPAYMEMLFFLFYEKYSDYINALSRLRHHVLGLTRLNAPITVNGIETSFNFVVNYGEDLKNGNYTGNFQTWLEKGKINDIVVNYKIEYPKIWVDTNVVGNVDILEFRLKNKNSGNTIKEKIINVSGL